MTRIVLRVVPLVALWLLAWGEVSLANVLSGAVVAFALLVAFPPRPAAGPRVHLHPLALARLAGYVVVQLIVSNLLVTREVVGRRSRIRTGVLAHRLRQPSDAVLSVMANVIALSPGTMTVDVSSDPAVLYIHFLLLDDVDDARRSIARLERLVVQALGADRPGTGATR